MAGRILNRRQLRKQADEAPAQQPTPKAKPAAPKKAPQAKAAPRPKKPPKKKGPVRMCARWGVFDGGMKQLAVFDYSQRAAAEEKVAALMARKNGLFFLQIVKTPMAPPEEPAQA